MIHELSIFFTNYDSWQYTVTALGLVIVGGGLTAWKSYFFLFVFMGEVMLITLLNNQVSTTNYQNNATNGMAGTLPIIFAVICIVTDFQIMACLLSKSKNNDDEISDEEKPADIVKPPEITNAFDKEQFNKRQ